MEQEYCMFHIFPNMLSMWHFYIIIFVIYVHHILIILHIIKPCATKIPKLPFIHIVTPHQTQGLYRLLDY